MTPGGFDTNRRVLVTGGAGFIGSSLVRKLLKEDYKVTILDNMSVGLRDNIPKSNRLRLITGDVRDFELLSKVIIGHSHVIHLAAQAFIPLSYELPLQIAETNAIGSINLFRACVDRNIKRLVHISSSEVYGSAQYSPMDENHPMCPQSTYAVAKVAGDLWAQTFNWEHKLPVVILRPFNTFGPWETLPYFIPEMIRQCLKEPMIHVGNLESSRDFTFAKDTVKAIMCALEAENVEGEVINIGTCRTFKMKDILALIQKETGTENKKVVHDRKRFRPKDVKLLTTDNTKARKVLGWAPETEFEEGIRETIKWYRENGEMWGYEKHGWRWRY